MLVNAANLRNLYVGFSKKFEDGLGQAPSEWKQVATEVPSTTASNEYGWLGSFPGMREWLGDRVVHGVGVHGYTLVNQDWEMTVGVQRNHIRDDNLGIYDPMFREMGSAAGRSYDTLVYQALKEGFSRKCYDGQSFFDTDHPVLDENGVETSVSNSGGGSGTPWFLIDDTRALKPLILQIRERLEMVAKDRVDDDNVFNKKQFVYGIDGRHTVGYGFWQMAYGSKQTLNTANFAAAFAALEGLKGDYGRPLGLKPTLLVVPPSQRAAAQLIVNTQNDAAGASNPWYQTAKLLVSPWLA